VGINNLHFIGMTGTPNAADPPWVIDLNGMLSLPVAPQRLQMITRRGSQNLQLCGGVKLEQFAQRDPLKGPERLAVTVMKKLLRLLRAKAPDHT